MRPLTLLSPLIILAILGSSILLAYALTRPPAPTVSITVPEGATVSDINKLLRENRVLDEDLDQSLEGYLFPDTYEFFVPSDAAAVHAKFEANFNQKIKTIIPEGTTPEDLKEILIKASLIEKEVPDSSERRVVAGIMMKRLENNILLQMDASLCYEKTSPCLPIRAADKLSDSPWNTYRNLGLPPHPIANPGADSISAAVSPIATPYWFYLSDPGSGKTVFSKTLDEHNNNIVKYLNTLD